MTKDQEMQLLQALYDRLFDLITYQPQGGKNPFTKDETFIHFAKNEAIYPAAFADALSPTNANGDYAAAELFSLMVDKVSPMTLEWQPTNSRLSKEYKMILEAANTYTQPSDEAKQAYNSAYDYLHPTITETNPFTKKEQTTKTDSQEYSDYLDNLDAYVEATKNYRTAYNDYIDALAAAEEAHDANDKKKAQRDWNAAEPALSNAIKKAQKNLLAGNGKWVEQALATLSTSINDGIRLALDSAKEDVANDRWSPSQTGKGDWLLTYAIPDNWYKDTPDALDNFSSLTISSSNTKTDSSSTSHAYTFGASYNAGLWSVSAESAGEFKDSQYHMNGDNVTISCKIAKVSIMRPWFNEFIFRSGNWYTNLKGSDATGYVSNGKLDSSNASNYIPMIPVAFIVARDITIKADFTEEDKKHISQSASAGAKVGWGPFSVGGSYKYGHEEDHTNASFQDGAIKIPGMQIIGWVSRLMPASPLQSENQLKP
jgi:hypothetical protein